MFVDQIRIQARAGNGGHGSVSFRREKFVPKGGPDGGDGGDGGSVVLVADVHTDNLVALYYKPIQKAKHGANGMGRQKFGKSAPDLEIKVPVGTVIYRLSEEFRPNRPPEYEVDEDGWVEQVEPKRVKLDLNELEVVGDLVAEGQRLVLCQGGKGGKGNVHFKSSTNQAPHQYTEGTEGEEGIFLLELRKIADAGLVGYPNAGKSTLLSGISAARPRVANYPFTTLTPHIGVVELEGYERMTVADIPGLIEGAHANVGLGHDFLRHIMRCQVLIFVVDMAGSEGRDPIEDVQNLRKELRLYNEDLGKRKWVVAANKMDLEEAEENLVRFRQRFPKVDIFPISAGLSEGLEPLKTRIWEMIER